MVGLGDDLESLDDLAAALDSNSETPSAPDVPALPQHYSQTASMIQTSAEIRRLQDMESILVRVDRLFISRGTRSVLILPMLVIILYGLAQTFSNSATPEWWIEHVQPLVGAEIGVADGFYLTALFIIIADIGLLLLLLRLLTVTRFIFRLQSDELSQSGMVFKSAHGYAEMKETIDGAIRQVGATTLLMFLAGLFLAFSLEFSDFTRGTPVLLALSTGALLSGHGVHMVSNRARFNTAEPWGMLDAFSPPIHPAILRRPFTDVIKSHIDPLLAVRIAEFLRSSEASLKGGQSITFVQERLLHLLHLRRSGLLDEDEFTHNLESMMPAEIIAELFGHPELGEETWDRLLLRARDRCASFFRLHDRLRLYLASGRKGDFWFDVDMENLVVGQANLFAYVLNMGGESKDLVLKVQTPDFRPNECAYRLRVDPYDISEGSNLDLSATQRLPDVLRSTNIIWHSLLPTNTGEATVTVRLEDTEGNLISGRVLTVQNRPDMFTRLRLSIGGLFLVGAAIAVLSPLLPFFTSLIGL